MNHDNCVFCQHDKLKANSTFIAELEHSIALVDFQQRCYPGSILVVLKQHHEQTHLIPTELLQKFVVERSFFAKALCDAFPDITRINYANMGNVVVHTHEYLIARRDNDRNAGSSPFPVEMHEKLSDLEYKNIADKIRSAINLKLAPV